MRKTEHSGPTLALPIKPRRVNVALSETVHAQVRALALAEGRKVSAQLEMLIQRGLRTWGEVAA